MELGDPYSVGRGPLGFLWSMKARSEGNTYTSPFQCACMNRCLIPPKIQFKSMVAILKQMDNVLYVLNILLFTENGSIGKVAS